jgi:hypothetical protein
MRNKKKFPGGKIKIQCSIIYFHLIRRGMGRGFLKEEVYGYIKLSLYVRSK